MVDFLGALLLGIVQGVTEWLPVSSSGHLVLFQQFLGLDAGVSFDIMLHLSTLCVVLLAFRKDLCAVLLALIRRDFESKEGRMGLFIIIASIVGGAVALLFERYIAFMFRSTLVVGCALFIMGFILLSSKIERPRSALDGRRAAFIGIAQGFTVVPGISRSGTTVTASLLSGIEREEAVRFSFLLSIPAIAGASLYALRDAPSLSMEPLPLAAGMLASFIVGYLALKWLIRLIMKKRFWMFSFYCWALGLLVIFLSAGASI